MGKKILDSKALYVVLSIAIAVVMWFYVTSMDGNQASKPIRNITITFSGEEQLESNGLMIAGDAPSANITVKAKPAVLAQLTDKTVELVVDVATIERAGDYTLAYTVKLPSNISASQVQIINEGTGNVSFTVAEYRQREIELRGKFEGTTAEGYLAGDQEDFVFSPNKITISGQAELVNQVSYAEVVVTGENLSENVRGDFPYRFIGASGDVIDNLDVECSVATVHTTFPILATADIPLKVELVAGGGVSLDQVTCTLSQESLTVAGSKTAVEAIQSEGSIVLGTIDLGTVHDGDVITFDIALTDELTNISGVTQVTATLDLDDSLKSKTVEVTNIDCISPPDGWAAKALTQMVEVEVRGSQELLDAVTPDKIRVVADLKDINQAAGQYTVTANVYLDSVGTRDQIDVVGRDYKIVVSLYRA
ncbi:hypothetical protein B5F12_10375 [Pseudoflavonifractor sp. An176]|uniref:CdaR family protein n=1 Tax=Pseudoflavonifractor sp. An176 TaxID=1965572 RepID=UPI000B3A494B|nr:hypothetical protein [Pseudoflavonifractor sp. An176]OUP62421.1 hypothetical protein B5F12_10375 [Pseudoflavonifractor sp. An176]